MNISAVSHRSTIEFCYASDENTVTVNIKTAKDVDRAFIISEDPFIHELRRQPHWSGVKTEMHKLAELKYHIIWTVKLQPRYKRLRYYFELESEGNTFVVCENKICPVEENSLASMQYFKYAWLNVSDIITPPNWVKHTVWYQIMPDRFCRSSNSPEDKKFRNLLKKVNRQINLTRRKIGHSKAERQIKSICHYEYSEIISYVKSTLLQNTNSSDMLV